MPYFLEFYKMNLSDFAAKLLIFYILANDNIPYIFVILGVTFWGVSRSLDRRPWLLSSLPPPNCSADRFEMQGVKVS